MSVQEQVNAKLTEAGSLLHDARKRAAEFEGKAMPADVQANIDEMLDRVEELKGEAESLRKSDASRARLDALMDQIERPVESKAAVGKGVQPDNDGVSADAKEISRSFCKFLTGGMQALNEADLKVLQVSDNTLGGFLTVPEQFRAQLIQRVDDLVFVRQFGTQITLDSAESLGVPTLDTDLNDAEWTTELSTGSEDTALTLGRRQLRPHPLAKAVKISNTLLRRARLVDPERLVRDRIAFKFGVTQEKAFMSGDGSQKPLGMFTASNDGIGTDRDVTITTTSALDADKLIELKHTLKPQYWRTARIVLHRDMLRRIRQSKDGNGQYLWQPGLQGDLPNTILELPYVVSEFAPNTFTSGQYVMLIGDLSYYWIADTLDLQVQRLVERYADTNATGFLARAECDGMPVLSEAFVRGKW